MQESLSLRRTAVAVVMLLLGSAILAAAQDEGIDAADVNIKSSVTVRRGKALLPCGCESHSISVVPIGSSQSDSWR